MIAGRSQRLWIPGDGGSSGYFVTAKGIAMAKVVPGEVAHA